MSVKCVKPVTLEYSTLQKQPLQLQKWKQVSCAATVHLLVCFLFLGLQQMFFLHSKSWSTDYGLFNPNKASGPYSHLGSPLLYNSTDWGPFNPNKARGPYSHLGSSLFYNSTDYGPFNPNNARGPYSHLGSPLFYNSTDYGPFNPNNARGP